MIKQKKLLVSLLGVFLILGQIATAQDEKSKTDDKFDAKSLVGSWKVTSGKKSGAKSEGHALPADIKVTDKTLTIPAGPDDAFVMAYELDTSKSPMQIDLEIKEGPAPEGTTAAGIFKYEDNKLTLCYNAMGADRPADFESTEENGFFLFVMEKNASINAKDLVGDWVYDTGTRGDVESAPERLQGNVKITDETFTLPGGPDVEFVMAYELDTTTSPAQIDFEIKEGPAPEGTTAVGIIKYEDGVITVCYNPQGEKRPAKFNSDSDNGWHMFTLVKDDN